MPLKATLPHPVCFTQASKQASQLAAVTVVDEPPVLSQPHSILNFDCPFDEVQIVSSEPGQVRGPDGEAFFGSAKVEFSRYICKLLLPPQKLVLFPGQIVEHLDCA